MLDESEEEEIDRIIREYKEPVSLSFIGKDIPNKDIILKQYKKWKNQPEFKRLDSQITLYILFII